MTTILAFIAAITAAFVIIIIRARRKDDKPSLTPMAALGDSLKRRTGATGNEANKDAKPQLAALGYDLALNVAVGGKRTDEILAKQVQSVIDSGIKLAAVSGGWNDIIQGMAAGKAPKAIAAEAVANMRQTDTLLQNAGIVVIRTLPHYCKGPQAATHNPVVDAICDGYRMPWCVDLRGRNLTLLPAPDYLHFADSDRVIESQEFAAAVVALRGEI